MFSKCGSVTLCMLVGLLIAESVSAQPPGRGFGMRGRGGIISMAGNEAVQKELGLSDKEKEELAAIVQAYGDDIREQFAADSFQNASDEERQKAFAKLQEANQKLMEKYVPAIKDILKPEQFTRLQQISWQASGSLALIDPEVVKALELSKEQQEKIASISQEYRQKQAGLFRGEGNREESFLKLRSLSQERDQKVEEVLSKEQKDKFTELKGKPFDLGQDGRGADRKGRDKKE
jgi:Spy/CpxP family protein refolding chaperone